MVDLYTDILLRMEKTDVMRFKNKKSYAVLSARYSSFKALNRT